MIEKLQKVKEKDKGIEASLSDAAVISDNARYTSLMREYKELTPLMEEFSEYERLSGEMSDAAQLMETETDPDMRQMAEEEYYLLRDSLRDSEHKLKLLLLPKDPNDDKDVVVEIRAGAGGEEAALFAAVLFRMYTMYADRRGFKTEVMSQNETELGGYKEITFTVSGAGAYSRFKYESGVHRVQRVPETESSGRIQTSTATVAVLPEVEDVTVELDPKDLEIDTCKSSGAGGQHINKTSSAVRLTHLPTGIVVSCQTQRSQFQNKDYAMKMLRAKLVEIKEREHLDKIADIKGVQKEIAWGAQIRSYVFMPYTLVKDHRTGFENGNIQSVMDGDLDGFINAYLKALSSGTLQK